MDIRVHNRKAWDRQVAEGNPWTIPASPEEIQAARAGNWTIYLTPTRSVPHAWLPELPGKRVLCLASGGGQQGPILAAAGALVTVFDNSPKQLAQDRLVAQREGLSLTLVEGDMADLGDFLDGAFDAIVHPVSNVFVPNVRPVWREAARVLTPGGVLAAGFDNPVVHSIDYSHYEKTGELAIRFPVPYADTDHLSDAELARFRAEAIPLEFGHSLEDQIGGQLAAGFVLTDLYEDVDRPGWDSPLRGFLPVYIATRAVRP